MNINDPFGRMQAKQQRDYESLCRSLRKAGLTNQADAEQLLKNLTKRIKYGLAIIITISLILLLLLPELRIVTAAGGGLAALWLVNATRRGKEYIERYMREELADHSDSESF
ncbi:MAG: hypothetical protein V7752_09800 [Halopseudomonas sp.]